MKTVLCIPTLNPGDNAAKLTAVVTRQTQTPDECLIVDSGSSDGSTSIFKAAGMKVLGIPPSQFNHGRTRQMCVDMASDADIIIFLTQDAFLADREALERLLRAFGDIEVGAAYGRQLPRAEAASVEAHARLFNYPQASRIKTAFDIPQLGIKTAFLSNSFAAYRRAALIEVGGFPDDVIVSEDLYVASKMILSGWKIAYCADACVFHSHDYGIFQEFRRYFDIGVFHGSESWIRRKFGLAEGEGKRFFLSEFRYVVKKGEIYLILPTLTRNLLKYFGYHLGMNYRRLPLTLAQRLSMNKKWWDKRR